MTSENRIARYQVLRSSEVAKAPEIPVEVADIILSRQLLPVVSLDGGKRGTFGVAPIVGAGGLTITLAVCPPGTGPGLHAHVKTFETFTVLSGEFEFQLGLGGKTVQLRQFDALSVTPGEYRSFRNTGSSEGVLQVIISGGVHDHRDIYFPRSTVDAIRAHGEEYLEYFKQQMGLNFDDHESGEGTATDM